MTLYNRLKPNYAKKLKDIQIQYPHTYNSISRELNEKNIIGYLTVDCYRLMCIYLNDDIFINPFDFFTN